MYSRNKHYGTSPEHRSAAYARLFAGAAIVLMFWGAIVFPPDMSGVPEAVPEDAPAPTSGAAALEQPLNEFGARS